MPFKSRAEWRRCWIQYNRDIKAGRKPRWDCNEFTKGVDYDSLPEYLNDPKKKGMKKRYSMKKYRSTKKARNPKRIRKVHIGKNGGKYHIVEGEKRYI
jgi:hypothetical protein